MEDKDKESSKNLDDNENDNKNDLQEKVSSELLNKEDENMDEKETIASSEINEKVNDRPIKIEFKKPTIMIGPKRGKRKISSLPSSTTSIKVQQEIESNNEETDTPLDKVTPNTNQIKSSLNDKKTTCSKAQKTSLTLKYDEPNWSGIPEDEYKLEVLKSGVIVQTINLTGKSYHVVGRLPHCDISLAHPTISRFHAIIQYRGIEDENNSKGLYVYDLGSTHGTYWNGNRVPPNAYVRLHDSHIIKFGCSARKYIVQALHESKEEESELSYTELREKRMLDLQEREKMKAAQRSQMNEEERLRQEEEEENEGIDWGMGEDADEETDLTENPYAATNNEELYLNDPKKSLRGWFEREGYDLQYHTEERGFAQFLCWVDLPIENIAGHTVRAEALVKGKKKECVIQCALEACKILDRYGLLRQATHESKRRKVRNWEEDDYYSSDEDNFLDRTGSIEKKRQKRMKLAGKLEPQKDTYDALMEKYDTVVKQITDLVECMRKSQKFESESSKNEEEEEDALDAFMSSLNVTILTKADKRKMKVKLQDLRQEEAKLIKLLNPLRPSNLPPLSIHIVPLNEGQKPSEMFDRDVKMNQKTNYQTSQDETTVVDSKNTLQSKQNNINIVEKEESKKSSNEDSSETSDDKSSNTKESLEDTSQTSINTTETEDNLSKVKDVSVETKNLPKIVPSIPPSDQSSTKTSKITKTVKETYDKDVYNENYSTWVPPQNQSGDGKTSLNDKYGY
ncbi:PREDICTED: kanadaptin [Polistes dominula]|uniref:Kanadaptin n=1 Tax=Polistes dominula TaxID=743375 RepID=A0ABM1I1I9_POLDO|nr:PREDICTED: kanadaptin [Polistes dominula]